MGTKVDVIIVNYKTAELTAEAIRSVINEPELHQVIVVDNASEDESVGYLERTFKELPVRVIASSRNLGFGRGNNLGVEQATAPYIFLLNSDAQLRPGGLRELVRVLERNPKMGIVAPLILHKDQSSLQRDSFGRFPSFINLLLRRIILRESELHPDWLSGVAVMLRREELLRLGAFNPEFFMYFEDVELCFRYHKAGFQMTRCLTAQVVHLGGQSEASFRQKQWYQKSLNTFMRLKGAGIVERQAVKMVANLYYLLKRGGA